MGLVETSYNLSTAQKRAAEVILNAIERYDVLAELNDPTTEFVLAQRSRDGLYIRFTPCSRKGKTPYAFSLLGPSGRIGHLDLTASEPVAGADPLARDALSRRARSLVEKLNGDPEARLVLTDETEDRPAFRFRAAYALSRNGLRSAERYSIEMDARGGRVLGIYLPEPMDAKTFANDRRLPVDTLQSLALNLYADAHPFEQGEIVLSEEVLDVPFPYGGFEGFEPPARGLAARLYSPSVNARYLDLARRTVAIPLYHLFIRRPDRPYAYQVFLDAWDGYPVFTESMSGFGGPPPQPLSDLPERVTFRGVDGAITRLPMTSFTPPGRAIGVVAAKTAFVARFEPGQGTLWIRRASGEAYQAFRPDAALLKAMRKKSALDLRIR